MKKGILFDLDGTLWDSREAVALSWNIALERMGRPERCTAEWVGARMGKTMDAFAAELFPGEEPEDGKRMLAECMAEENEYVRHHGGILVEGLEETLKALKEKGLFLAIVSNCQEGYIEAFLEYHRLGKYIDDTENFGRTGQEKDANIRLVVERNHLDEAVYLGDTQGDYDAAAKAGVPFLHAAYGFGSVPEGTPALADIRLLPETV
ncbi:MAG: HAD family hydrolase [Clostridia bacterium]|nr:HAD family hydrolase [Clostridia bacterium]